MGSRTVYANIGGLAVYALAEKCIVYTNLITPACVHMQYMDGTDENERSALAVSVHASRATVHTSAGDSTAYEHGVRLDSADARKAE